MPADAQLEIAGKSVSVRRLEKVFYPKTGFTKGNIIDYYVRISPVLLPYLKDRPITLKRYPDGVDKFFFYEKQCPQPKPPWVKTVTVAKTDGKIDYALFNNLPTLVWAANLANLELHTFLHRSANLNKPNFLAFDLDPGPPADVLACCQVALWLKELLAKFGLQCFPKTSGSKGLQIYVPLNTPITYEKTKPFAHAVAELLEREHPEAVVSKMLKELRKNKVLVDWSQNDEHKTTVNVYSLRAKEQPTVSTPVSWLEITAALKKKKASLLVFETEQVLKRVEKLGDLFAPVLTLKQKLPLLPALPAVAE